MQRVQFYILLPMLLGMTSLNLGCGIRRTLSITSEPAGALVYLNDEEVGRTPLQVPFKFYGTYDVRLEKEGQQPLWTMAEAKPPWWAHPGPDLIASAVPDAKHQVDWHFTMEPATPAEDVDPDELIQNAARLQQRLR